MGANIAGIYGAQIFRADDKPLYRRGFTVAITVLAAGVVMATVRYSDDILRRRREVIVAELEKTGDSLRKQSSKSPAVIV